ncbi:MAG: 16S rRNA (cytidine(1402)-2'-O)-methyltransferase [Clostridiales bacterium]|nr:16S rRNA (cytidine(1402)-2'-O)-methyltransferase [Clostridiales bacterium]
MMGILYLCATPIGNMEDITLRCLKVLREVDIIAAEDTRRTSKLLNHYEIKNSLISYYEHNKKTKGEKIINILLEGKNVALVTDAGMPCISDPGEDLVKLSLENNIEVVAIPGASASLTALSVSGLATNRFVFEGFLAVKGKNRIKRLEEIAQEKRTIILYEAPHRLLLTLKDLLKYLGNRNISISRELTKKFEETIRTYIKGAIDTFTDRDIKGEFVLVIEGKLNEDGIDNVYWESFDIEEHLIFLIHTGFSKKDAIAEVARLRNIPKKEVYKISIEI